MNVLVMVDLRALIDMDAIDLRGSPAEQRVFFGSARARSEAFERVPQRGVTRAEAIYREIAFEHGASGTEGFDAGFDVGFPHFGEHFGILDRVHALLPASKRHGKAAELHVDVRAFGKDADVFAPFVEAFVDGVGKGFQDRLLFEGESDEWRVRVREP